MKVLSINTNLQQKNNAGFKGLWGKPEYIDRYDSVYNYDVTKYPYYPFSDEKKKDIQRIVDKYSFYNEDMADPKFISEPRINLTSIEVAVMAALPFTAKEFSMYLKNRLPIIKHRLIERIMSEKNLTVKMR